MSDIIAIGLIVIGTLMLGLSLRPVHTICQKDDHIGWCILRGLVGFFILGYIGVFYYAVSTPQLSSVDLWISAILFGGGIFVVLVVNFSLQSILKIEAAVEEQRYNALHDSLTGLSNRTSLYDCLDANITADKPFSLFLLDLDRFKQINDALGHYYGDFVLVEVGKRFKSVLPEDARLFRLGGDEFAIVTPALNSQHIRQLVSDLQHSLDAHFDIDNYELSVGASVGISHFPEHGGDRDNLILKADLAMYAAKHKGTVFKEYESSLESDAAQRVDISARLKHALDAGEFTLWYQPIVDLQTNQIHGAEALIRWPQADGSFIAPDKFIGIAEQSSLINRITDWVLSQVTADINTMREAGFDLCVHINLSVKDLQSELIVPKVRKVLDEHEMSYHQLMLEVTESAMMTNIDQVRHTMSKISEAGLVFSVDDFGTGFSSLAMLRDLPVGQIKIDRSFVSRMTASNSDHAIVESTAFLAHNLDCTVVAEGVEDEQTAALLSALGCDYAQGYYYSKPLQLSAFVNYLNSYLPAEVAVGKLV